jgi:7-keto-8-aminopelargonate synthetase-like enzyme
MGFFYPVVPEGQALLRAQVTVRHDERVLREAAASFAEAARTLRLA